MPNKVDVAYGPIRRGVQIPAVTCLNHLAIGRLNVGESRTMTARGQTTLESLRGAIYRTAKRLGFKVMVRTINEDKKTMRVWRVG